MALSGAEINKLRRILEKAQKQKKRYAKRKRWIYVLNVLSICGSAIVVSVCVAIVLVALWCFAKEYAIV
jgi:hypothetical protein